MTDAHGFALRMALSAPVAAGLVFTSLALGVSQPTKEEINQNCASAADDPVGCAFSKAVNFVWMARSKFKADAGTDADAYDAEQEGYGGFSKPMPRLGVSERQHPRSGANADSQGNPPIHSHFLRAVIPVSHDSRTGGGYKPSPAKVA